MPKYIVRNTHIVHGKKGEKERRVYGPGDVIELSEEESLPLKAYLDSSEKKKAAEKEA